MTIMTQKTVTFTDVNMEMYSLYAAQYLVVDFKNQTK